MVSLLQWNDGWGSGPEHLLDLCMDRMVSIKCQNLYWTNNYGFGYPIKEFHRSRPQASRSLCTPLGVKGGEWRGAAILQYTSNRK